MGVAFSICLERKQQRESDCGVTMNYNETDGTFTRFGSFRFFIQIFALSGIRIRITLVRNRIRIQLSTVMRIRILPFTFNADPDPQPLVSSCTPEKCPFDVNLRIFLSDFPEPSSVDPGFISHCLKESLGLSLGLKNLNFNPRSRPWILFGCLFQLW